MSGNSSLDKISKDLALSIQTHLDTQVESVINYLNTLDLKQSVSSSISEKIYQNNDIAFTEIYKSINLFTENFNENEIYLNPDARTQESQICDTELEELNRELSHQKSAQSKLKQDLIVSQQELSKTKYYLSLLDD